ncbi:hypothetical protein MUK51_07195 [Sphingobacterium faecium]|uniref:DUF7660 family protein n=1 Tax=Sphingobacterium faecium TaxID=34087 RepID=UPI0021B5E353|nr:hypothetical protein [Sphingobacterium faecium]UXD71071.1 hypothetical protein MUK51_07195 [Sphingobacterium faecium]
MSNPLYELKITDKQSFLRFLGLLREDFISNPEGWENKTLPDFLEALATDKEDIQGYYNNSNADIPVWSTFGNICKGAKVHE